jgi:tetratricopeptide (TPR) repeat protein
MKAPPSPWRPGAALALGLALLASCSRPPHATAPPVTEPSAGGTRVEYTVQVDDGWPRISELFFGTARMAPRIAQDNGASLEVPPEVGSTVTVRIPPEEMGTVRQIAEARGSYNTGVELMQETGQDEAAVRAFRRALDKAPHFVDARYNLGLVLLRQDHPREAEQELRRVVAERDGDKDAHYALASALFHQERYPDAEPELRRSLDLDPGFLRAQFTYAMCLERQGRSKEARDAWQRYLELDSSSAWAGEARAHLQQLP